MQKSLATQVKMPKLLSGVLYIIAVIMLGFVTFMLVDLNASNRTRSDYPLPDSKSFLFKAPGHEYQLRTSKPTKSMGLISNLRWLDTRPEGNGNVLLAVYYHDFRLGGKPKSLMVFENTTSLSRFYWSKDGSLFVIFTGSLPTYAYDFQEHKNLAIPTGYLPEEPTAETQKIESLLAKRGGKVEASFSQAQWISLSEFQKFPKAF